MHEHAHGALAVEHGAVGRLRPLREPHEHLEEDGVEGDEAVHALAVGGGPQLAEDVAHAGEVGDAVDVDRHVAHRPAVERDLLVGQGHAHRLVVARVHEVPDPLDPAQAEKAVLHRDPAALAGEASGGADLHVVLREHAVHALPRRAQDPWEHFQQPTDLVQLARQGGDLLLGRVHGLGELGDVRLAHAADRGGGLVEHGGRLPDGVGHGLDRRDVEPDPVRALRDDEPVELDGGERLRHGHEGAVHQAGEHVHEGARRLYVLTQDGDPLGRAPQGPLHLRPEVRDGGGGLRRELAGAREVEPLERGERLVEQVGHVAGLCLEPVDDVGRHGGGGGARGGDRRQADPARDEGAARVAVRPLARMSAATLLPYRIAMHAFTRTNLLSILLEMCRHQEPPTPIACIPGHISNTIRLPKTTLDKSTD